MCLYTTSVNWSIYVFIKCSFFKFQFRGWLKFFRLEFNMNDVLIFRQETYVTSLAVLVEHLLGIGRDVWLSYALAGCIYLI